MAEQFAVISALGADRPGLVADLTQFLVARGANVEESRMVLLGAEFGVMMLISGQEPRMAEIAGGLAQLEASLGLRALYKVTRDPRAHRAAPTLPYLVTVESLDREGIVHAVATTVRELGLNIVSLDTSSYAAPFSGGTLFRLQATIDVPPGKAARELRQALDQLANQDNLDIEVKARG